ncbi:alpha/beta hydrolase family protein [Pontixanthobacter aquaemixtae]|uniref:Prolyl oligopeptidase family serine peptidase n=1 Tax=Pontixanthobacter aquaemixtae TaxID=1958940 RepID=A0A844ZYN1_9SPHN|nr:S9 family peptidase [Pontixanthobacter aquaemixtae]MXO90569.1 prolyl oligopeptidase family serine peptidase [Pontixanthobacter aquaemixtae]
MKLFARLLAPLALASVPFLAHAAPTVPLEYYGDLPAIQDAVLSPSGAQTALLATIDGERVIRVLRADGTPVTQLRVGEAKIRSIEWIGEEAILLLRTETDRTRLGLGRGKYEWLRANVIPLRADRQPVSVFANQSFMANAVLGFHGIREVGGRWKGYFGGLRMGRSSGERAKILHYAPGLFEVDLQSGDVRQIAQPPANGIWRDWLVGKDGNIAVTFERNSDSGDWTIANGNGNTIASGRQRSGYIDPIGLGATGETVIYSVYDDDGEGAQRFEVPLSGGESAPVWQDTYIDQFFHQPFTGHIIGILNDNGAAKLADTAMQSRIEAALNSPSGGVTELNAWTADLSAFLLRTSGKYDSGTWYRFTAGDGQRAIIGLERPAIQGPVIGDVRTFQYKAADGLEMEAVLTLPPGKAAKNLPVIMLPHGGPTAHDEPGFDWWAQAFAAHGYAVMQPNFRGSTGYGAAFRDAGNGEWGRKMQSDISDGLRALADAGIADPDRACIVGASYGGYAALAGVTLQNGLYRCAVSVNGVSDLPLLARDAVQGSSNVVERNFDTLMGKETDLSALSPARNADRADAPVLLIHGKDDTVVPFEHAASMEDALKDAGKPVKLVSLADEDHWLSQAETRKQMLSAAMVFVRKHNPAD